MYAMYVLHESYEHMYLDFGCVASGSGMAKSSVYLELWKLEFWIRVLGEVFISLRILT